MSTRCSRSTAARGARGERAHTASAHGEHTHARACGAYACGAHAQLNCTSIGKFITVWARVVAILTDRFEGIDGA